MKLNSDFINEYLKGIFKPGAVLVSYGMRGGGKTHCAVSYCQRLIEGYYPDCPKHVVLITNVIFVKKSRKGFVTESPPGVYTIHSMKEIFPIVTDTLEKYGRKDTMIVLLLDEAQNFLLGDMNNVGDMASSMKKFCGIISRCKELLVQGATVILSEALPGKRATRFDVIAVYKGDRLINMDSQVLNGVLAEALPHLGLFDGISSLRAETTYGDSRFDFCVEHEGGKAYVEVKGVTLEKDGIVFFPDAPTERGIKHVRGLADCIDDGYGAYLIFVIQMSDVDYLSAEGSLHPGFWNAVEQAEARGVKVLAYDCLVEEDSITLRRPVRIQLR